MDELNIKSEIYRFLRMRKCGIEERNGITIITAPDDSIWDFTIPTKRNPEAPRTFWEGVEDRAQLLKNAQEADRLFLEEKAGVEDSG